jgi:ABC-type uncharacterized transport system YnjBCD substrate-binding protein
LSPTATLEGHFLNPRLIMRFGPRVSTQGVRFPFYPARKTPFSRGRPAKPRRPETLGEWVKAMPNRVDRDEPRPRYRPASR